MQLLKVKNLEVELGGVKILEDINFEVSESDVLAIIGPNGAGKTMLLKALLDLIPYRGEISWQPNIKIGYVPQRMDIETDIPLTVKEFLYLKGPQITDEKIKETFRAVQIDENILKAGLGEISVGQRQRVLVAWAVIDKPEILIFDEPTADIDIAGQESIYKMLHYLQNQFGLTIILVSHDLNVVYRYAKKVMCLNRRALCFGAPNETLKPEELLKLYGAEKEFYVHKHQ